MRYKGVIFDLDGTLVNSIEDIGESLNKVLCKHNLKTYSINEYEKRIGRGLYQLLLDSIDQDIDNQTKELLYNEFLRTYERNYLNKTKAYPKIKTMLKKLQENQILLAINSNKKDEYTKDIARKLFSEIGFVAVIGDRKNINKKPDPTSANEIVEKMNLSKNQILYIGDSEHDIICAKNANLDSLAVNWGYRSIEELKQKSPTHTASSVDDIIGIVLSK